MPLEQGIMSAVEVKLLSGNQHPDFTLQLLMWNVKLKKNILVDHKEQ